MFDEIIEITENGGILSININYCELNKCYYLYFVNDELTVELDKLSYTFTGELLNNNLFYQISDHIYYLFKNFENKGLIVRK